MLQAFHQRVELLRATALCRKLFQPFTEHGVERLVPGFGQQARLLDQLFIRLDDSLRKNSAGVAMRSPVRLATACVKCLVLYRKKYRDIRGVSDQVTARPHEGLPGIAHHVRIGQFDGADDSVQLTRRLLRMAAAPRGATDFLLPHREQPPPGRVCREPRRAR